MGDRYFIRIEAWPYSLEEGRDVAQALAGPRQQSFIVTAEHIKAALVQAELFRDGMLTNPYVHQARITEIREARHDERVYFTRPCVTSVSEARSKRRPEASPSSGPIPHGKRDGGGL